MAELQQFREKVTIYRKRQIDPATGRPYTLAALAKTIGLSADELGHRLRGTGRSSLAKENVLAIVCTLAAWETLIWGEAVHLLTLMDYPLDPPDWRKELQRFLAPPPQLAHRVSRPSADSFREDSSASVRRHLFQARDLPKGYVPRPKVFEAVKHLLLNCQDGQSAAITTALRGAGGFGKTTLALALCHDQQIQAAFPDGILWVELGEHPPRSLEVLNGVLHALEPALSRALTLEEARDHWRSALFERTCLLVIDDVWQAAVLEPLLEGGPYCVRLITTRNDQVLPEETRRILVDTMEPKEAIAVLRQGLPDKVQQAGYQPLLETLTNQLRYWPLLLSLARGMIVSLLRKGRSIAQALSVVEQAYQKRGITAFHLANASERQRTADACLEVSLRHLEEFTPTHYHATARYLELAVFPEDADIPLTTLQTYWKGTDDLELWETEDLCSRLYDLSLLLICNLEAGTIRLHDVLRSYLVQQAGPKLPALHARFLDVSQQVLRLNRWADLPQGDAYLWRYLILHLCQADRRETLQATLTDLVYFTRKILYVGTSSLETDLLLAITWFSEPVPPLFVSLYRTLIRISHLLQQVYTLAEIGGLLLSYFSWESAFAGHELAFQGELPHPFLTANHPLRSRSSTALFRTLYGHTASVNGCAVSPDGRFIVSASDDHTLKVWEMTTGEERMTLAGHTNSVKDCAVSPDGSFIVSAAKEGIFNSALKVWNTTTGEERMTLSDSLFSTNCAVSPDGHFVVSASDDHTLKIWEMATGEEHMTLTDENRYSSTREAATCTASPDGRFVISGFRNGKLAIWNTATGKMHQTLSGHFIAVKDHVVSVSTDERLAFHVDLAEFAFSEVWDTISGEKGQDVHWSSAIYYPSRWVQDTNTGEEQLAVSATFYFSINDCAVSPDGSFIVSASGDGTLKVWDAITGTEQLTLTGHTKEVRGCAVSPDGRFIVSASQDGTLKVWDAVTGEERLTFFGHTDSVNDCAVSPDGRFIVSASDDHTLKVWEVAMGEESSLLHSYTPGHTDSVNDCAVSPDGRFIVSASGDCTLKVWDAITGTERLTLRGHTRGVRGCAVSPDGSFIVSASSDGTLKVWDAATGEERFTLSGHTSAVSDCVVSPDGRFVVSASHDRTLRVWDVTTTKEHLILKEKDHAYPVTECIVSPDGRWIISVAIDQTLKVWETATGEVHLTLPGRKGMTVPLIVPLIGCCTVSPDSCRIISTSTVSDSILTVWDVATGEECLSLSGHTNRITSCSVSPDGSFIISTSLDGMVKLWDADAGECLLTFPMDDSLRSCAFYPDGKHVAVCGDQGMYFLRLVV